VDTTGAKLLPFYIVVDVSYSMSGQKIRSANAILPAVRDAIAKNPILSDKVRIALLEFSDIATVRMPLCDIMDPHLQLPTLAPQGGTSYAAAFSQLRSEIGNDIKQLKQDGFAVHRPAVFFLSDGIPTDAEPVWRAAFADLVGDKAYPNVIPFGVDEAAPENLRALIHPASGEKQMKMYLMDDGAEPAGAITAAAEILISSIVNSGHSLSRGQSGIVLPDDDDLPPGMHGYDPDDFVG